ncbi:hypothetical protein [Asticcacaulis sp. YBE204]|uniref:hypothetical protein n=1 Tax=Asticcacaulis sp. YBE204 TaxID=1282363 RepID=UPI0003C3B0FC|nr:hypothetical protein [Asticcacaulis sp. YBE204]ESQ80990.1 hypothetical protein AEYBE204_01310 [Asticcacaulis sp. YBE204]
MRKYLLALAGLTVATSAAALPVYLDDRSTPQSLIQSYYNAINRGELARAYTYYERDYLPEFQKWAKGYENTREVWVVTGKATSDPGAGNIYYNLPVAVQSVSKDGTKEVFAGCYVLHITNYGMQIQPPYQPMTIRSGKLVKTNKSVKQAVPKTCQP